MVKKLISWIIYGLCAAMWPAAAALIELTIEPDSPTINESFRLTFSAQGRVDEQPDFSPLEDVLDILRRNRQTSIQIINGKHTSTTTWSLDVMAGQKGKITIPSIAFGSDRSPAREIEIGAVAAPADADADADAHAEILLEVDVEPRDPYVQQQTIYTVRLLRRVELSNASLSEPETSGDAIINQLAQAKQYQLRRHGRRYDVFERRFAIFPQTSGPLTIDPLTLTAQVVQRTRSRFDPFGQSVTTRRLQSEPLQVQVKPIPDLFPDSAVWLPAKRLRLNEEWGSDDAEAKIGDPLTRTITLWVDGLTAGQLPEIPMKPPDGVKTYPEQAQTSEEGAINGYNAIRQEKYAMIAHTEGPLRFAAIEVPWWNTDTDTLEVARLPERYIEAVDTGVAVEPPPVDPEPASTLDRAPLNTGSGRVPGGTSVWFWTACGLLIAWMATLAAWYAQRRGLRDRPPAATGDKVGDGGASRFKRDLRAACKANNPAAAKRALLLWAASQPETPAASTIGDLTELVDQPLAGQLQQLNKVLYSQSVNLWDGQALWAAFEKCPGLSGRSARDPRDELEPLFHLARQ